MKSSPLYQTDIPYAAIMLTVVTVPGAFVGLGIFFALSAAYPRQPPIWWTPIIILVSGYLALLIMYRMKRSPDRHYDTSTTLLTFANATVFAILAIAVLLVDVSLIQVIITFCDLLMVAFYFNYFVICLTLWVKPKLLTLLSLVAAAFTLHHGVTHLPPPP
jgi:hypothetical protein